MKGRKRNLSSMKQKRGSLFICTLAIIVLLSTTVVWGQTELQITTQPQSANYIQGEFAELLEVTVSGVNLTYQWYVNNYNSNAEGTPIAGATQECYHPKTTTIGKKYYYVEVTNELGTMMKSSVAKIIVFSTKNPTITLTKYKKIKMRMTREEVEERIGGKGTGFNDKVGEGIYYLGAKKDPNAVKKVKIYIDNNRVYEKKSWYAFKKESGFYYYTGKTRKLIIPSHVTEQVGESTKFKVVKKGLIKKLNIEEKKLTELNVKKCKRLKVLNCSDNKLAKLNLKKCTKLRELNCINNRLKSINVKKCTKLLELNCNDNRLTGLNVKKCVKLKELHCVGNQIRKLNVRKCTRLSWLDCSGNKIKRINVTKNKKIRSVWCNNNCIKKLNLKNNKNLISVSCYKNSIQFLDLSKNEKILLLEVDKKLPKSRLPKYLKNFDPVKICGYWQYGYYDYMEL